MAIPGSQRYPWHIYRINNVEDIVVFLGLKVLNSDHSICFPAVEMRKSLL